MKFSAITILGGLAAFASASPLKSHVVHEKREVQTSKWTKRDVKLNRDALIPMSIGLTQRNLENGYEFLMDVSHPESENYGKHWSMEKVSRKSLEEIDLNSDNCRSPRHSHPLPRLLPPSSHGSPIPVSAVRD